MQERRAPSEQICFVEGASLDRDQQWRTTSEGGLNAVPTNGVSEDQLK